MVISRPPDKARGSPEGSGRAGCSFVTRPGGFPYPTECPLLCGFLRVNTREPARKHRLGGVHDGTPKVAVRTQIRRVSLFNTVLGRLKNFPAGFRHQKAATFSREAKNLQGSP